MTVTNRLMRWVNYELTVTYFIQGTAVIGITVPLPVMIFQNREYRYRFSLLGITDKFIYNFMVCFQRIAARFLSAYLLKGRNMG